MDGKRKVEWSTTRASLSQMFTSGLEFAFVSTKGQQCCPFVHCKDFLQDAVFNQIHRTQKSIYGFCFNPESGISLSLNKTRLLIANSQDPELGNKIPNCLDFINQIEKKLKMPKTRAYECLEPPKKYARGGVWWLDGSLRWLSSPPMLSLYTLLLRISFSHKIGDDYETTIDLVIKNKVPAYQSGDSGKLSGSIKGLKRIVEKGDRNIFHRKKELNYPKGVEIHTLHNNFGIVGFSCNSTKTQMPYWHRKEVE